MTRRRTGKSEIALRANCRRLADRRSLSEFRNVRTTIAAEAVQNMMRISCSRSGGTLQPSISAQCARFATTEQTGGR